MGEAVLSMPLRRAGPGLKPLQFAGRLWFCTAVAGQWLFAAAIAVFYGSAALDGDFTRWNGNSPRRYVPGETFGNVVVGIHLAFAVILLVCGPLQFVRAIRTRFPVVHRWSGRVYLVTVSVAAVAGAYMILTRGTVGDSSVHLGFFLDALLVIFFMAMAWKCALARDFNAHRIWVLRLFMVANAVWFFRVGFMFWIAVNQGAVGFDKNTFTGPFITFLAFAQTLLPLGVLQLYLLAEKRADPTFRMVTAALLVILTGAMALGIVVAGKFSWLPRILGAA